MQPRACRGYNPLTAIEIVFKGNAAMMIEKASQNNPADQDEGRVVTDFPLMASELAQAPG